MDEALVLFVILGVPLLVILGVPTLTVTLGVLGHTAIRRYFQLQQDRLKLDRERMVADLELRRLAADLPPWLDGRDPAEVAAWRAAVLETTRTGVAPRLTDGAPVAGGNRPASIPSAEAAGALTSKVDPLR